MIITYISFFCRNLFKYICLEPAVAPKAEARSIDGGKEPTAAEAESRGGGKEPTAEQGKQVVVKGNFLPYVAVAGAVLVVALVGVYWYRNKNRKQVTVREIVPGRQNVVESLL